MYGTPTVKEIEKATTWSALKAKLAGREDVQRALIEVAEEVLRAERQHPAPYHSPHEGHALALGKPILLIGDRSNIFHHLTNIKVVDDSEDLYKHCVNLAAQV